MNIFELKYKYNDTYFSPQVVEYLLKHQQPQDLVCILLKEPVYIRKHEDSTYYWAWYHWTCHINTKLTADWRFTAYGYVTKLFT